MNKSRKNKNKNKNKNKTLRGGKLIRYNNCNSKNELENDYSGCIIKQDTYDNTSLVLIETSVAGNRKTASTPIIDNIFYLIQNYDFSPKNTYFFSDYKAFSKCMNQLGKNESTRNIFKNIIEKCNNSKYNRKISKKLEYNNNSKKNYEIALHFIQSMKRLGHTELLEDINVNNSNAQRNTLEKFNIFIENLVDNIETRNLIISMQGHGDDDVFGLLDNPKPELKITSEDFYNYVLTPLESVDNIENIIIIANHCEAETFYIPLFVKINEENYSKNVFMIKLQMNILKIPFYNQILFSGFVMDEDYTGYLPYDDVKDNEDNEYKGELLKNLISRELYQTIIDPNAQNEFIGVCSRAGGSELYKYIDLLYKVRDFEELKDKLIRLYINMYGNNNSFSGKEMLEYWRNYDNLHEIIKDELKSQLFKIYISDNSNVSSLNL